MQRLPRTVIDPGVLVSALISRHGNGPPSMLVDALLDGQFILVVSPSLLSELRGVLLRSKFRRYVSAADVDEFISLVRGTANVVPDPAPAPEQLTDDPDDDYLVLLADDVEADFLVSGDAHLVRFAGSSSNVLTPREFLTMLEEREPGKDNQ